MKKMLLTIVSVTTVLGCFYGCASKGNLKAIEGEYVRYDKTERAIVKDQYFITLFNEKTGQVSINRIANITRIVDGQPQTPSVKTDNYTGFYLPDDDKLTINERGLDFKVNLKDSTLSVPNEVFKKVSSNTAP
ncbi:hypothetical protein [uncultured Chitinophaga sp.]|uniref:hypothetical protein n=1 Tax=uncultured Chitinophaga sp. TaxID=339340 RepID=UPI002611181D|nr:hypothetical protein [uncultured Chitinophaga sp.]